jgi:hypothetical protein
MLPVPVFDGGVPYGISPGLMGYDDDGDGSASKAAICSPALWAPCDMDLDVCLFILLCRRDLMYVGMQGPFGGPFPGDSMMGYPGLPYWVRHELDLSA